MMTENQARLRLEMIAIVGRMIAIVDSWEDEMSETPQNALDTNNLGDTTLVYGTARYSSRDLVS